MKEISLHILDITRNSVRAEAKNIGIDIRESDRTNSLEVEITDDGHGMTREMLDVVEDPFTTSRTTRKVGMGIPLLKQHAEITGGAFSIESEYRSGTKLKARFVKDHIDRQPMGDICGVLKMLLMSEKDIEFVYNHSTDHGIYTFTSKEAKEVLEIKDFSDYQLVNQIAEMIKENLKDIHAEIT